MKVKKQGYQGLMILTIVFSLMAIGTLIPAASASKMSMAGYKAYCTFTPISTVFCLLAAALVCRIRKNKFLEITE